MFKELLIYIKIVWAIEKELRLQLKLAKHQCKMVDIHEKYKKREFKNSEASNEYDYLHSRIVSRFK